MRAALFALPCVLAAACQGAASCQCGGGAGVGVSTPSEPPAQETGGCRNVTVPAGSWCRFNDVFPQSCAECAPGEEQYRVAHFVDVGGVEWGFGSAMVKIPAGRRADLEAFLTEHSPVACSGEIVNPPCNPDATHVELDLPWPEWVKR